jgi:hypothetical protein
MDQEEAIHGFRESVLFIGTQFSNLYTALDTSARGRMVLGKINYRRLQVCQRRNQLQSGG